MPRGTPSIPTLIQHGATLLQEYSATDAKRTEILRTLAKTVVGIRAQTLKPDGKTPDWAGQSQAYRDSIREMYEQAGVPTDAQSNVQAALRYHIGNVLRDTASPKALTEAGLATKGPQERMRLRANGSTAQDSQAQAPPATTLLDAVRACTELLSGTYPDPSEEDKPSLTMGLLTIEALAAQARNKMLDVPELVPAPVGSIRNPKQRQQKAAA